jgi:hypothetical protein
VYFDGSSDLGASDGGVLNFGANNYTVEFWVYSVATMNSGSYPTANTGPCFISGNTTLGWAIYNNVTAGKGITIGQGNVTTITDTANSNVPLPTNQWNHIAVSRSSGTLAIWLNGTRILQVGSATNYSGSAPIKIGSFNGVTGGHNVKGYMAGVHILNNVALYDPANATIAVPTAPPAVTASTVCLLNFNNAAVYDAASFFNLDTINGAAASTGQPLSLSNNSCLALGGGTATPCVSSNRFNNYLINFEKNDFTMEAWLWLQTAPTGVAPTENAFIVSAQNNLVNPQTWALYVTPSRTIALLRTTAIITTTVNAIPLQTWVHVAVVRQNNIVTTYLNGVADTSIKVSGNFNTTDSTVAPALVIGRRPPQDSTSRDPFVGLISDLRITRAARYVNDFVPSVSPLPVTGSTQGWWPYTIQVGGNLESDTMVDVPANWGTDNGGTLSSTMRGNYPTISLANKGAGFTVSNGGLDVSSAAAGSIWRPATATHAVSSGKWYWEVVINSTPVGNGIMMGVANTRWDAITENVSVTYPGGDAALNSWGYYINGSMFRGGAAAAYGTSYTASDVIGFALDMDNGTFYASKNGVWQGINNASNPVVSNPSIGRNPINQISGKTFPLTGFHFPAFGVYGGETYVVNFGQRPFVYANALQLSAGFKPICTTNIVPPLRRPGNFFEATSYTGGTNTFNPDPAAGQLVLAMPLDSYNTHFDVSNEISNRISQPKALYTTAGVTYTSISGAAFNGTTGYIELSAHPDFDLGITGNWTIEWYQYWNVLTGFQTVWSNNYVTIPNLLIQSQNNLGRHQLYTNGGTSILNEGNAPTPSLWYHYAVVKNGSTYTIFRNGSATGVTTYNAVTNAGSPTFRPEIGRGNGAFFVNGNIRDFRIYKGWAKYTTTFNPATATTAVVATTGTGFDKFINLGFQPDLVWVKARNIGKTSHILVDSVRGGTSTLSANSSDTATVSSNNITFNQTGFTVGGSKTTTGLLTSFNSQLNTPGATYTAYGWKRNALAGFDIVGFNKLNATNETFNHSLGRIPEMIIVKGINAATNWNVYHSASISTNPASIVTTLNTQAASVIDATMWNNTRPTASQFSLGTVWPAGNYAAYLFAEIPGFSRFGSYTGNASINGSFVWCGFKPRFVLTKKVTGTSDWLIWDSSRGPINPISPHFVVNSNAADQSTTAPTYNGYLDFTATGFKLRLTSAPNDAGEYIFAAFADNPFGRVPGQVLAV